MKLRHAAALALVGWYLTMPPVNPVDERAARLNSDGYMKSGKWTVELNAPLVQWTIDERFDTTSGCEVARTRLPGPFASQDGTFEKAYYKAAKAARCIATDDPRLKSK